MVVKGERRTIINGEVIRYKGLFDPKELYKLVEKFLKDKGYDKRFITNDEFVLPTHRDAYARLLPWKKLSDYEKAEIKMDIAMTNLKEEDHEVDGAKLKLYNGNVSITFFGYLTTDYEGQWHQKPILFFVRTFIDKFLYSSQVSKMEGIVSDHIRELENEISAFLNMYKWQR